MNKHRRPDMRTSYTPMFAIPLQAKVEPAPFPSGSCNKSSSSGGSLSSTVGSYARRTNSLLPPTPPTPYVVLLGYFELVDKENIESPGLEATESRVLTILRAVKPWYRLRWPIGIEPCYPTALKTKKGIWNQHHRRLLVLVNRLRLNT
jgi:hypothetical protein